MILELEKQCAPLALCQRLKELGAPQETWFGWYLFPEAGLAPQVHKRIGWSPYLQPECAAHTVAELGEMLWQGISAGHTMTELFLPPVEPGRSWAEALAARLIALAEGGITKW